MPALMNALMLIFNMSQEKRTPAASGGQSMTLEEARQVLGVHNSASEQEIKEAYRRMIQKNHPDIGGSKYIAAKINQARDILLKGRKQ